MRYLKAIYKKITMKRKGLNAKKYSIISHDFTNTGPVTFVDEVHVSPKVQIGKYTYMHSGYIESNTVIGNYCSISRGVDIAGSLHPMSRLSSSPVSYSHRYFKKQGNKTVDYKESDALITKIGNDVWIGANAIIRRGVTVGDSVVIGAGAVVTKDLPSFSIAVGVPAKVIKSRKKHEKIVGEFGEWWEKEPSEIDFMKGFSD